MGGNTSRRVGLSREKIIEQALVLTGSTGLASWSMRDLAATLDVVPSVIYHYFPTRAAIGHAVCDQVLQSLEVPQEDMPWQQWVIELLMNLRRTVLAYNGVMRHIIDSSNVGRPVTTQTHLFELFMGKLGSAGFGSYVPMVYAMIINVACTAIAEHDRQSMKDPQYHDIEKLVEDLSGIASTSPALAMMCDEFLAKLHGEDGEVLSEQYFFLLLTSLLDGLVHVVLPLQQKGSSS